MRTFKLWPVLLLGLATLAHAQQVPSSAPPKLETLEEPAGAPVTVTAKPTPRTTEVDKREQGKVTEAQVTSGGSTYVVKSNTPAGTGQPGDAATGSGIRGAQWKILDFDLGGKKKKQEEEEAASSTPPPPEPKK